MMAEVLTPTALVVDDNYYNRDLCTLALLYVGYRVTEAKDGLEALKILEKQTFDLLILDLEMPELDGVGVIRHIYGQERHEGMSIVVMTANHHMATEEVDLNVEFVVYKPIDVEEFARLLKRLAKRSSQN